MVNGRITNKPLKHPNFYLEHLLIPFIDLTTLIGTLE